MKTLDERYLSYLNSGNSFGKVQVNTFLSLLGNSYNRILEVGCGKGFFSYLLLKEKKIKHKKMFGVDVFDSCQKDELETLSNKFKFKKIESGGDLPFPPNYFDLVFSHGVLEHFTDKEIVTLLNMQLKISKILIFSVPSNYLSNKDRYFGNERFLSMGKWEGIINNTEGEVIETFGFHYLIGWRGYWDTFIRGKILGPSPYFVFVLQKK